MPRFISNVYFLEKLRTFKSSNSCIICRPFLNALPFNMRRYSSCFFFYANVCVLVNTPEMRYSKQSSCSFLNVISQLRLTMSIKSKLTISSSYEKFSYFLAKSASRQDVANFKYYTENRLASRRNQPCTREDLVSAHLPMIGNC